MAYKRVKTDCFHYYKDWWVFPAAVTWNRAYEYYDRAWNLSVHFLCWHWRWTFVKEKDDV